VFDYHDLLPHAEWGTHAGLLTRYGDVRPLVDAVDDRFVIMGHGEEVALSFDASVLRELTAGWTRTFFFYANGFEKGYELATPSADTVGPLPFQAMGSYPYDPSRAPAGTAAIEYQDEWSTRPPFLRRAP
jgi:hypothetical protein